MDKNSKTGDRATKGKHGHGDRLKKVCFEPIPFGGFYFEDDTGLAEKVYVAAVVQRHGTNETRTYEARVDVDDDDRYAFWPGDDLEQVVRVWCSVVNRKDQPLGAPRVCESRRRGRFIEMAEGRSTISPQQRIVHQIIHCTFGDILARPVPPRDKDFHIMEGIPLGRFYYENESDSTIPKRVRMAIKTLDPHTGTVTSVPPRHPRIKSSVADFYRPAETYRYKDVVWADFQPQDGGGNPYQNAVVPEEGVMTCARGITNNTYVNMWDMANCVHKG